MFILKLVFILFLIALLIIIGITIYNKFKNPDDSFIECIPFINEFSKTKQHETKSDDEIVPLKDTISDDISETKVRADDDILTDVVENTSGQSNIDNEKTETTKSNIAGTVDNVKKEDVGLASSAEVKTSAIKKKKESSKPKPIIKKKKTVKKGDNIKKVNGIGPVFEKKLNAIGINSFEHIANWSDEDMAKVDEDLNLAGRPQREEWVAKAKVLLAAKIADA